MHLDGYTHADAKACITANVACHESRLQALAGRQFGAAFVHSRGKEDGCGKLSRNGMGSVSGIVRCPIVLYIRWQWCFPQNQDGQSKVGNVTTQFDRKQDAPILASRHALRCVRYPKISFY